MSNYEQQIWLWIYKQLDRLFLTPPNHIIGYNLYGTDISNLEKYCDEPLQKCQKIMIDEFSFEINHDDIGYWSLNEDVCKDIQIWGENGEVYIHFEDEENWWELKIVKSNPK